MNPPLADLFLARYQDGGRGDGAFDCFGLFAEVCRRRGVAIPAHPTPAELSERDAAITDEAARWIPLAAPEPWCAVVFRIGPWVSHIGVVIEDGLHFVHANKSTGVTMDRLDGARWGRRIAGYYRHA